MRLHKHIANIDLVCSECGITANVLQCLKKFNRRPDKLSFDVSTFHKAECDCCGEEKMVTQVRDFFYPDFRLLFHSKRMFY